MATKTVSLFFAIVLIFQQSLFAQRPSDEELYTEGHPNGKLWEKRSIQERIFILLGIEAGLVLAGDWTGDHTAYEQLSVKGFRTSDLVSEIDLFYDQRSNIRIPVAYAYTYVIKKMRGETSKKLDEYAAELRKSYNK